MSFPTSSLTLSAPYPFVSRLLLSSALRPSWPCAHAHGHDGPGIQGHCRLLPRPRQVVDLEKQPQEPVSSVSKQDTSERKPDVWVGENWFAGGEVEVEVAPDFPRYPTLAEVRQEPTTTNVQDEVKAEGEKGGLMEVANMVSLALTGSRAQLPLPTSPKRMVGTRLRQGQDCSEQTGS